jgi:hypothetical protein
MLKRSLDHDNVHLHLHSPMHPNIQLHAHKNVPLLARAARKGLMASFKAGGSRRSRARPDAAHDHLSLLRHQSPVLRDAGGGRLT